jgi:hypothetical protein
MILYDIMLLTMAAIGIISTLIYIILSISLYIDKKKKK